MTPSGGHSHKAKQHNPSSHTAPEPGWRIRRVPGQLGTWQGAVGLALWQLTGVGAGTAAFALAPALPWHQQWLEEGLGCHYPLVPREVWQKLSNSGNGCAGPTGAALVPSAPAAVSAREQLEILNLTSGCSGGLSLLLLFPWL